MIYKNLITKTVFHFIAIKTHIGSKKNGYGFLYLCFAYFYCALAQVVYALETGRTWIFWLLQFSLLEEGKNWQQSQCTGGGSGGGAVMSIANTQPHPCSGHLAKLTLPCSYILSENQGNRWLLLNLFLDGMVGETKKELHVLCLFFQYF